jgi:2-methylcitrate dehydratase PrpD
LSATTATAALTAELARRASVLAFADIPADVVRRARHALLDWFGVTLAGSREEAARIIVEALPAAPAGDPRAARVVGRAERLDILPAALANGTASHALDFDDVNMTCIAHITVAVAGAALALAEHLDADGERLLTAFVAGYETVGRVGAALGPAPYLRGQHATGTIGTFGAAAACSRLLGLDAERTAVALSLAATQAAGLKSNLGTMSKPLHAGKACENGLLAALLAARGFTANPDAIEAAQGFAAVSGGERDAAAALGGPPAQWHLRNNLFKYHAACYMTHPVIDAIRGAGVDPGAVLRIVVHISELERGACVIPEPATALEVKFSLAHLAAMAVLGRGTSAIDDADAADPELIAMRAKVELADDGEPSRPVVDIELADGTLVRAEHDSNTPEDDLDAQHAKLAAKFAELAEPVLGPARAAALAQALDSLDSHAGVRELMALAAS